MTCYRKDFKWVFEAVGIPVLKDMWT